MLQVTVVVSSNELATSHLDILTSLSSVLEWNIVRHSEQVEKSTHGDQIEHNVYPIEPEVSPDVTVLDTDSAQEFVPDLVWTVGTLRAITYNRDVTRSDLSERTSVLLTGKTWWWFEVVQLDRSTDHRLVVDQDSSKSLDEVSERRDFVHESPEPRHQADRLHNTT
ncbi:hypothetical protein WICPIJ_005160, partial [Wickerhamomyces pijperi]